MWPHCLPRRQGNCLGEHNANICYWQVHDHPILYIGKLRHKSLDNLPKSEVGKWQNQDSNPGSVLLFTLIFYYCLLEVKVNQITRAQVCFVTFISRRGRKATRLLLMSYLSYILFSIPSLTFTLQFSGFLCKISIARAPASTVK